MKLNPNAFRSNDIRGVYGLDFDEDFADALGRSFGMFLRGKGDNIGNVVIGRDIRRGSDTLAKALISGLTKAGFAVTDIGLCTTPLFYFTVKKLGKSGGIMVTGSHLPPEHNGFKIVDKNGAMVGSGAGLEEVREIIVKKGYEGTDAAQPGVATQYQDAAKAYMEFVLRKLKISKDRKLKVVVDTCNSVGGLVGPELFRRAGCEVVAIHEEMDSSFPSRPPEPRPENLSRLQGEVVHKKADLGVAYDGDADRVVFVDNEGKVVESSSIVIMMFAEHYLTKDKASEGAVVVFDLGCSMALPEMISSYGGKPVETKVGTAAIKEKMAEHSAIFGGESSNHLYFSDMFGFDDGVYASLKMAEIVSNLPRGMSFADKVRSLPNHHYFPEWEFECADEKKAVALQMIKEKFKSVGVRFSELDGLKLYYGDGWVLWRPSGTKASMKIYIEAKTKERLEQLKAFAKEELERAMV
jgi:phosphomannomutase / phosphoglucomutase